MKRVSSPESGKGCCFRISSWNQPSLLVRIAELKLHWKPSRSNICVNKFILQGSQLERETQTVREIGKQQMNRLEQFGAKYELRHLIVHSGRYYYSWVPAAYAGTYAT